MNNSENINFNKVDEMAEGDVEFKSQLIHAIYTSIEDLKTKYVEGLKLNNEELIQQARHKIKPTLSLFELKNLEKILKEGKILVHKSGFEGMELHQDKFLQATDDLLNELNALM